MNVICDLNNFIKCVAESVILTLVFLKGILEYNENMRFIRLLLANQIAYIFRSDDKLIYVPILHIAVVTPKTDDINTRLDSPIW